MAGRCSESFWLRLLLAAATTAAATLAAQERAAPQAAEAPPDPTPVPAASLGLAQRRQELAQLQKRIAQLKARHAETRRREADLKEALRAAELNLQIRTAERRVVELRQADAAREAESAVELRDGASRSVSGLQKDLSVRVGELYRMGRLGYLRPLAAVDSGRALLRGLQVLSYMARRDAELLARYQESLAGLQKREAELAARRKDLADLAAEARAREQELAAARTEKAQLLARVQRTADDVQQAVETLMERTGRLASLLDLLETRGRDIPAGTVSIRRYKGVLDWPARGRVAVPFGRIANPRFPGTFLRSTGWTIEVETGTEVRAVFAGDVVHAQWMKGYGNLVVLDHGDGVFTVYARLANGTVTRGERVGLGDRVGQLGDSPEDEAAGLYFEVRESRQSVDPQGWLK